MYEQIAKELKVPWYIAENIHWKLEPKGISRLAAAEQRGLQEAKTLKTSTEQRILPSPEAMIAGAPARATYGERDPCLAKLKYLRGIANRPLT